MAEATRLDHPNGPPSLVQMRLDAGRNTYISVQRNINKDVYVQIGKNREITLILHPHAAKRLVANIQAVLDGTEFATL